MIPEAALAALGAGVPLVLSQSRRGSLTRDAGARDLAFYIFLGSGVLYAVTGSSLAGALAIGSGGTWVFMKGDDIISRFP